MDNPILLRIQQQASWSKHLISSMTALASIVDRYLDAWIIGQPTSAMVTRLQKAKEVLLSAAATAEGTFAYHRAARVLIWLPPAAAIVSLPSEAQYLELRAHSTDIHALARATEQCRCELVADRRRYSFLLLDIVQCLKHAGADGAGADEAVRLLQAAFDETAALTIADVTFGAVDTGVDYIDMLDLADWHLSLQSG